MQNGVEGRQRLTPLVGPAAVVPAVVYCGTELIEPGRVKHSGQQRLIVPDDDAGRTAATLAEGTPLQIDPSSNHDVAAWVKLGINTVANGLTALTGRPMNVLDDPGVAAIGRLLLTECWTVGRLEGVELDLDVVPKTIAAMGSPTRTSMQQDREAGRPTEHDAIHGAVLRAAARHDQAVPVTRMVHDLLAAASADAT
jgi:2-dehydropantoate 2-reductase